MNCICVHSGVKKCKFVCIRQLTSVASWVSQRRVSVCVCVYNLVAALSPVLFHWHSDCTIPNSRQTANCFAAVHQPLLSAQQVFLRTLVAWRPVPLFLPIASIAHFCLLDYSLYCKTKHRWIPLFPKIRSHLYQSVCHRKRIQHNFLVLLTYFVVYFVYSSLSTHTFFTMDSKLFLLVVANVYSFNLTIKFFINIFQNIYLTLKLPLRSWNVIPKSASKMKTSKK